MNKQQSEHQHHGSHCFSPMSFFRGVRGVFAHTPPSLCRIKETKCEAVLKFPRGQYDASELSVNILVDDTTGDNILQVKGGTEQLFVIGDSVDTSHLSSTFDDGVFMIMAPKHTGNSGKSANPCFRPIEA